MNHQQYYQQEKGSLKVLIADDNPLERLGIKAILEDESRIDIIGETGWGREVIDFIKDRKCNMIVLNTSVTEHFCFKIIQDIKKDYPELSILALGSYDNEYDIASLLRAGINGYFHKTRPNEELLDAISVIQHGRRYISPIMEKKVGFLLNHESSKLPHESLSYRERQVMSMMSTGKSVTEISNDLSLSVKTVSTYRTRIFSKLKIERNAHLIMYALQHHLVN